MQVSSVTHQQYQCVTPSVPVTMHCYLKSCSSRYRHYPAATVYNLSSSPSAHATPRTFKASPSECAQHIVTCSTSSCMFVLPLTSGRPLLQSTAISCGSQHSAFLIMEDQSPQVYTTGRGASLSCCMVMHVLEMRGQPRTVLRSVCMLERCHCTSSGKQLTVVTCMHGSHLGLSSLVHIQRLVWCQQMC